MWKVIIDDRNAIYIPAPCAESAAVLAKLQIWNLTGKWVTIQKVEEYK
jgi:hypothetical protein